MFVNFSIYNISMQEATKIGSMLQKDSENLVEILKKTNDGVFLKLSSLKIRGNPEVKDVVQANKKTKVRLANINGTNFSVVEADPVIIS